VAGALGALLLVVGHRNQLTGKLLRDRTSTSRVLEPSAARTSSLLARIEPSPSRAVNVAGSWPGTSVLVGRPPPIRFSRGPLTSLTASWP